MRTSILGRLKAGAAASILAVAAASGAATGAAAQTIPDDPTVFQLMDVFDLEEACANLELEVSLAH